MTTGGLWFVAHSLLKAVRTLLTSRQVRLPCSAVLDHGKTISPRPWQLLLNITEILIQTTSP